jgi:hypothetical protein
MSGDSVRAILDGRKTMTRRVVKCAPDVTKIDKDVIGVGPNALWWTYTKPGQGRWMSCPFGMPGDRLWVRETFAAPPNSDLQSDVAYRADITGPQPSRWTSPLFMPRWASRLTLEVDSVRVERLQSISEADACNEIGGNPITRDCKKPKFRERWDEINGKRCPWSSDPFCWVIGFHRV